jgi:hypothetical protein
VAGIRPLSAQFEEVSCTTEQICYQAIAGEIYVFPNTFLSIRIGELTFRHYQ